MQLQPSLDDLRTARPDLAFALYAMDPGGPVTLEVHHAGQVYTFKGATEADAIIAAFPPESEPAQAPIAEPTPPQPDSIFD